MREWGFWYGLVRMAVIVAVAAWFFAQPAAPVQATWKPMVYDFGSVCLYVTDQGGIWGQHKAALVPGPDALSKPCPYR